VLFGDDARHRTDSQLILAQPNLSHFIAKDFEIDVRTGRKNDLHSSVDSGCGQLPERVPFSGGAYRCMTGVGAPDTNDGANGWVTTYQLQCDLPFALRTKLAAYDNGDWHC